MLILYTHTSAASFLTVGSAIYCAQAGQHSLSCVIAAVRRLYSSAHFNDSFPQHSDPEVLKTPLEGVALIMKAMGIDKVWLISAPSADMPCDM